jgi:hypothetical protein
MPRFVTQADKQEYRLPVDNVQLFVNHDLLVLTAAIPGALVSGARALPSR